MAMFETRRVARRDRRIGLLVAVGVLGLAWSAWSASGSPHDGRPEPPAVADPADPVTVPGPAPLVTVTAQLLRPQFVATRALTDFGLDLPVRYVAVRILAQVDIAVRIHAGADVVLKDYPRLCLIGPFSAPDYAGLSEPCWGEPDLGLLLRPHMATNPDGRPWLRADSSVTLRATLERDADRCDYPPGDWRLEVEMVPVGEGVAGTVSVDIEPVPLAVAATWSGPLPLVRPTNYCGIANVVYREQGEPVLAAAGGDAP